MLQPCLMLAQMGKHRKSYVLGNKAGITNLQ
jgi:hypothetical protein